MSYIAAVVHVLGLHVSHHLEDQAALLRSRRNRSEDGSVTMENVLWAVAVIAIVAIVVAAIRAYVTARSAEIT